MRKFIVFLLLFVLCLSGCAGSQTADHVVKKTYHSVLACYPDYHAKLKDDPDGLKIYENLFVIFNNIRSGQEFDFYDMGYAVLKHKKKFLNIVRMFVYDHPEYGVYFCDLSWQISDGCYVKPVLKGDIDMVLDSEYQELYDSLNIKSADDLAVARDIFLHLSENLVYDQEHFDMSNCDRGAFYDHKACCQGIAFMYKRLLRSAGIPSFVITGYNPDQEYHMINGIIINNRVYFVDVTGSLNYQHKSDKLQFFAMDPEILDQVIHEFRMTCLE